MSVLEQGHAHLSESATQIVYSLALGLLTPLIGWLLGWAIWSTYLN
jgi:hypothetical protein